MKEDPMINRLANALLSAEEEALKIANPSETEMAQVMRTAERLAEDLRAYVKEVLDRVEAEVSRQLEEEVERLKKEYEEKTKAELARIGEEAQRNLEKAVATVLGMVKGAAR